MSSIALLTRDTANEIRTKGRRRAEDLCIVIFWGLEPLTACSSVVEEAASRKEFRILRRQGERGAEAFL